MRFKSIDSMEIEVDNGRKAIRIMVDPDDYAIENGWRFIVTEEAIDCDCGKGMYCPYVKQEKV